MKKLIITAMAALLAVSLAGCAENGGGTDTTTTTPGTTTEAAEATETTTEAPEEEVADVSAQEVFDSIHEAYGETFMATFPYTAEEVEAVYGLTADLYEEFAGGAAMITTFVDKVLVVKAAEGKIGDVVAKLEATRDLFVADTMQYPMNMAKVKATQVVQKGDFAALIMAGAIDEREDVTEDEQMLFAVEETQKGIDAFNNAIGG